MRKRGVNAGAVVVLVWGLAPLAVEAQEVLDWSGFYASVYGGYAIDTEASTSTVNGPFVSGMLSGTESTSTGRVSGLFGGIAGGYNYQHDRMVMGIEGSAGLGDFGKSNGRAFDLSLFDGVNTATLVLDQRAALDINWYTSLQGKLGFAHENWLFFLKGGAVVADASVAAASQLTMRDPGGIVLGDIDDSGSSTFSQILVGPAFGFGAEVMVADHISVSAEYSYFGLPDVNAPAAVGMAGGLLGMVSTNFTGGMHQLKAGVSYHF